MGYILRRYAKLVDSSYAAETFVKRVYNVHIRTELSLRAQTKRGRERERETEMEGARRGGRERERGTEGGMKGERERGSIPTAPCRI